MSGDEKGLKGVMAEAIAEAGPPVLQPSLFPAELVAGLDPKEARDGQVLRARGAGRPAGALNKRTAEFRNYVLSRGGHPVDGLIEAYSRPVATLAAELGCTLLEAFQLQVGARKTVLEYVEGKMPVTVDLGDRAGIAVVFETFGGVRDGVDESDPFQGVTIEQPDQSNKGMSNDGP